MPTLSMQASTHSFGASTFTPKAPKTSALPDWLDTERLPCLATRTPAPATTKAQVVEILKVPFWSPPVPQVSRTVLDWTLTRRAFSRITHAAPVISSTVSPFILSAVRKDATCKGVASPVMISFITVMVSSSERLTLLTSFSIASRIFILAATLLTGGKGAGKVLLRFQDIRYPLRLLAGAELAHTDAVPESSLVSRFRQIGVVALILKSINRDFTRSLIGKSIDLHVPCSAGFFDPIRQWRLFCEGPLL